MNDYVVVGDGLFDCFFEKKSTKECFENALDPEIVEYAALTPRLGGAWNVAHALEALGNDVNSSYISQIDEYKNRYFDRGRYTHRVDEKGSQTHFPVPDVYADNIVVVDYNKGGISTQVFKWIYDRPANTQLWIHAKRNPERYLGLGAVMFSNNREWPKNVVPDGLLVQTLGERGIQLVLEGRVIDKFPSRSVLPHTVVGAGDYTMAGFIDACVKGGSYRNALEWSQEVVAHAMRDPYSCWLGDNELNWQFKYGGKKRF